MAANKPFILDGRAAKRTSQLYNRVFGSWFSCVSETR
jgi:hypothetical protein